MDLQHLISTINYYADNSDYASARRHIEDNLEILRDKRVLLKNNAREILKFLLEQKESGKNQLSRKEMKIIYTVNHYANDLSVRGIRLIINENLELFKKKEAICLLNTNAKIILEGMGVIEKS